MQTNAASTKKRISIAVEGAHVGHIRNCLAHIDHENFSVSPIISGWGVRGYWSSECGGFDRIGEQVMIRFTTDLEPVQPLLRSGFGILASKVLKIQVTSVSG
ncbi:MAG: hypothetical protein ABL901_05160 [Hyphomicrobiaceae bacterium]